MYAKKRNSSETGAQLEVYIDAEIYNARYP